MRHFCSRNKNWIKECKQPTADSTWGIGKLILVVFILPQTRIIGKSISDQHLLRKSCLSSSWFQYDDDLFRCASISWIHDVRRSLTENNWVTDRNQLGHWQKIFNFSSNSSNSSNPVMWCDVMWYYVMWCDVMWCEGDVRVMLRL